MCYKFDAQDCNKALRDNRDCDKLCNCNLKYVYFAALSPRVFQLFQFPLACIRTVIAEEPVPQSIKGHKDTTLGQKLSLSLFVLSLVLLYCSTDGTRDKQCVAWVSVICCHAPGPFLDLGSVNGVQIW